jgi:hypothetical protein
MTTIHRPALDTWFESAVSLTDEDPRRPSEPVTSASPADALARASAIEGRLRLAAYDLHLTLPEGCLRTNQDGTTITLNVARHEHGTTLS